LSESELWGLNAVQVEIFGEETTSQNQPAIQQYFFSHIKLASASSSAGHRHEKQINLATRPGREGVLENEGCLQGPLESDLRCTGES
jgi:hypothetical protein